MPRTKKLTQKKPKSEAPPEWKRMNARAQLEKQLLTVIDMTPVTVESVSSSLKIENRQETANDPLLIQKIERLITSDTRTELDQSLVSAVHAKRGRRIPVAIRRGEHEPSAHVLPLIALAARSVLVERRPIMEELSEWVAPFEEPPSVEGLANLSSDLFVDEIDPQLFLEQYTPANADHAYFASYGILSRLTSPFYRLELAPARPVKNNPKQIDHESTLERAEQAVEQVIEDVKDREQELVSSLENTWSVPVIIPRLVPIRVVAGLIALLAMVSLPAGAATLVRSLGGSWLQARSSGEAALAGAQAALSSDPSAADAWRQVSKDLSATDRALNGVSTLAVALGEALPRTRAVYGSARALVRAGERASDAAATLTAGLRRTLSEPVRYPVDRLQIFKTYLDEASPLLDEASNEMARVKLDVLPAEQRSKAEDMRTLLAQAQISVRDLRALSELMTIALGADSQRRYLFIFQNPSEIRATGGFMGSLADITFDRGEIKQMTAPGGGPYDLRSQLKTRFQPPKPMQLISERWEFQDVNWSPDFSTSAETIRRFWSDAGQPTVDGLVTLNARLVENILALVGPIEMPEYGKTITAQNFMLETQKAVELEYDREENKPKKFIGDLMPRLLEKLKALPSSDWPKVLTLAAEALETRDVQIAFFDPTEAELVDRFGWSSRIGPAKGDALAIVNTNIAGQKTDAVIDEAVHLVSKISDDGSVLNTLTITRNHRGQKGELFRGVNNVNYVRVYVPEGALLQAADGFKPPPTRLFKKPLEADPKDVQIAAVENQMVAGPGGVEILQDLGRTVFAGWTQVEPGDVTVLRLTYKLPVTAFEIARAFQSASDLANKAAYVLQLTSQSGMNRRTVETSVQVPEAWKMEWQNRDSLKISGPWQRDQLLAVVFEP